VALACLAEEADHAGDRLARQGYALLDGSGVDLAEAARTFDDLQGNSGEPLLVAPEHPLVSVLLGQPSVRSLLEETVGPGAKMVRGLAFDQQGHASWFLPWHQAGRGPDAAQRLILRWHLDLIGPADGGLRVLPGSHLKGRLSDAEIAHLVRETPAQELAVSAGTVIALRPLLVQGARRRTTRGHRRILQVELAAG
jgi:ectoine hydroxylase-related dioxygenase (phytanoyl-CoA dioxygenase family)